VPHVLTCGFFLALAAIFYNHSIPPFTLFSLMVSSLVEYLEFNPQARSVFPGVAAIMGLEKTAEKTVGHRLGTLVPLAVGGLLAGGNAVAPEYFGAVKPKKRKRKLGEQPPEQLQE
jgi:hypothetical protein